MIAATMADDSGKRMSEAENERRLLSTSVLTGGDDQNHGTSSEKTTGGQELCWPELAIMNS